MTITPGRLEQRSFSEIKHREISTFFLAPSPYDCNFDSGTCTWTHDTTGDFQWSRQNHGTASSFTGPDHDHTSKNGKYVMYT